MKGKNRPTLPVVNGYEHIPRTRTLRERDIMLVTDCPLEVELQAGYGHSSQSASSMFQSLNKVGIKRTEIHCTYMSAFRPAKADFHYLFYKKGAPVDKYVRWEQGVNTHIHEMLYGELTYLRNELHKTQPKLIIVSGQWALYFLLGVCTVTETKKSKYGTRMKWRGSHLQMGKWWEYHSIHIAVPILGVVNQWTLPGKQKIAQQDFSRIGRLASLDRQNSAGEHCIEPSSLYKTLVGLAVR